MNDPAPGRLVTLPAREVWGDEARVFTPWLAKHLDLLADALQLGELELSATEVILGDFRLDILAEDGAGNPVVIENQFGRTDHGHLGQLISYVASQGRPTITIWVAEQFKDSHRAAVDWLNATTSNDYPFFAVEIEALRIGDSAPAPFFNVVAKPNSWTKIARVSGASVDAVIDQERHRVRSSYWSSFAEYLRVQKSDFVIRRDVRKMWMDFPIGRTGAAIRCTISTQKQRVGVELYLFKDQHKTGITALASDRQTIENAFGEQLDFQELPGRDASRVALYLHHQDLSNSENFPRIQTWMLERMQQFRQILAYRVKALDLGPLDEIEDALG